MLPYNAYLMLPECLFHSQWHACKIKLLILVAGTSTLRSSTLALPWLQLPASSSLE